MRPFGMMRVRRAAKGDRGFTLIEVICAVLVLSISLVGGLRLISQQTRVAAGLEQRVFAHWVALNTLERRRLGLKMQGAQTMGGSDWQVAARETEGPVGLRRVEITVTGAGRAGGRIVGYLPGEAAQ